MNKNNHFFLILIFSLLSSLFYSQNNNKNCTNDSIKYCLTEFIINKKKPTILFLLEEGISPEDNYKITNILNKLKFNCITVEIPLSKLDTSNSVYFQQRENYIRDAIDLVSKKTKQKLIILASKINSSIVLKISDTNSELIKSIICFSPQNKVGDYSLSNNLKSNTKMPFIYCSLKEREAIDVFLQNLNNKRTYRQFSGVGMSGFNILLGKSDCAAEIWSDLSNTLKIIARTNRE